MKLAVTLLVVGCAAFGVGAIVIFAEARANSAVLRDGIGVVTLVNAEWLALLLLAAVCGATALILAYVARAVDVLASPSSVTDSTVDEA